jgi:hypothetical protein
VTRRTALAVAGIVSALVVPACGGLVVFVEDDGGQGGSTSTGTGASSTKATTGVTTPVNCHDHAFGPCVSNPACAPVFDDACCPSCGPGPCSDCVDWEFIACMDRDVVCEGRFECGFAGEYVCQGSVPDCFAPGQGCPATIGCEPALWAECPPGQCPPACVAIVAGACNASCDVPAPPCPPGMAPHSDGSCWTGMCIDAGICGG